MKFFISHPETKKYLLPLVMAIAVFFVSQGVEVPDFSYIQDPQLSVSQKTSYDSVVVKTQTKCSQAKSAKNCNHSALVTKALHVSRSVTLFSVSKHHTCSFISTATSIIPARAPPA